MNRIFKNKVSVLIALCIIFGVLIGVLNATGIKLTFFEKTVNSVVSPVQSLITGIGDKFNSFIGYFDDVDKIKEENIELKKEISELKNKLKSVELAEKENETLRSMLGLMQINTDYDIECAQIVARDPGNWFRTFTVNKGSADGVMTDQTVISSDKAIVGRVYDVGSNWAKIITVTDPEFSCGAMIERSGDFGIAEGDSLLAKDEKLKLSYISKNTNLIVGDSVLTSGLGGIFPKGLSIGKINSINTDVQGISQYAIVVPECNLDNIKEVLIIKNNIK